MINHITLSGRLTEAPQLKTGAGGNPYVNFTLAFNAFGNKDKSLFIPCLATNKLAETIYAYVSKGDKVCISGELIDNSYQNKEGKLIKGFKVFVGNIEFMQNKAQNHTQKQTPAPAKQNITSQPTLNVSDDEIPF